MSSKYWEVLGIEYTKDLKLIKAAYAKMIKQCKNDHEKFLEVNTAYKEIKKNLEAEKNQELFITIQEDITVVRNLEQIDQGVLVEMIKKYEFQNINIKEEELSQVYQNFDLEESIREIRLLQSYFEYNLGAYKKYNAHEIYDLIKEHSLESTDFLENGLNRNCVQRFVENVEREEYFLFQNLRNDFWKAVISNDLDSCRKIIRETVDRFPWAEVEIALFRALYQLQNLQNYYKSTKEFAAIFLKYKDITALNYMLLLLIYTGSGFKYYEGFIYVNILDSKLKIKLDPKNLRSNSIIPIRMGRIVVHEKSYLDILEYSKNSTDFNLKNKNSKISKDQTAVFWLIFFLLIIAMNVLKNL